MQSSACVLALLTAHALVTPLSDGVLYFGGVGDVVFCLLSSVFVFVITETRGLLGSDLQNFVVFVVFLLVGLVLLVVLGPVGLDLLVVVLGLGLLPLKTGTGHI